MALRRYLRTTLPRLLTTELTPASTGALSEIFSPAKRTEGTLRDGCLGGLCARLSTLAPTSTGPPPTVAALKNPSNAIAYDDHHHDRFTPGDPSRRAFTYFVLTGGRFLYAAAIRLAVLKFILSMTASKDVLAMASLEVDISAVEVGQSVTLKWRGKPVFVRRRSPKEIAEAQSVNLATLRDPAADADRVVNPEWLVVIGVCTHLGCVPIADSGDYGGWFCPCHGSHYDISGRIRKGPAPYNLAVPEYKFLDDSTLLVG